MGPTAALLLLLSLLILTAPPVASEPPPSEKAALLSFISQVRHLSRISWNSSASPCTWTGVFCDLSHSSVVELHLPAVGLVGSIPPSTLSLLPSLRVLSLRHNALAGPIPADLSNLTLLRSIYLQNNAISDGFPRSLTALPRLSRLNLAANRFSGEIPFSVNNLTKLRVLLLDRNNFSGQLPSINISTLASFNVSYNFLNGSIPQTLSRFPASSFAGNLDLCGYPLRPCAPFFPSPSPAPAIPPAPTNAGSKKKKKLSTAAIIGIAVGIGGSLLLLLLLCLVCCLFRRRKSQTGAKPAKPAAAVPGGGGAGGTSESREMGMTSSSKEDISGVVEGERNKLTFVGDGGGYSFDLEDLLRASAEVLGKGSVGTSCKATLEEGTTVVVKRLKNVAASKREFELQTEEIRRIDHRNLLPLRTYYYSKDEKLLVFDYLAAGSLSSVLQGLFRQHGRAPRHSVKPPSGLSGDLNCWERYSIMSNHMGIFKAPKNLGLGSTYNIQHKSFASASINIQRDPLFSTINDDDVSYFKEILGDKNVIQDEDRLLAANMDWMGKYKGSSQLLLLPKTTEQVSKILQYCNSRRLAVVPQGGNTGLVGGSVPVHDEVIVNTASMDKIISFDKVNGILICEAGCILDNLNSFLANEGFIMPLDLGAKGSCQIGGNISTNAGGLHFIRYGSLHGNILGLEVVLANGTVLDMLTTLRKDNTGYDLKHLFIGSEGTLAIVTKAAILTPPKLVSNNVAFLACNDFSSCQKLLLEARRGLGDVISAFEFMDSHSMNMALDHLEGVRNPLPPSLYNFYVLIETTGSDESYDKAKLEAFLLRYMEGGLISDGVIAQDMNQASSFWRIREGLSEASMKEGAVYKYDLSLPVEKLYDIVDEMRSRLGHIAKVIGYGHLGDGNLHLNITTAQYDDNVLAQIEPFVYRWTSNHRGSISAEHGLGVMKADKIHYSKSSETVQLMASIKKLLDPNRILNPYKVLPQSLVDS